MSDSEFSIIPLHHTSASPPDGVSPSDTVQVILNNGTRGECLAAALNWSRLGRIIAYRVIRTAEPAIPDGYTRHTPGPRPCGRNDLVSVVFRGSPDKKHEVWCKHLTWGDMFDSTIIAYRVIATIPDDFTPVPLSHHKIPCHPDDFVEVILRAGFHLSRPAGHLSWCASSDDGSRILAYKIIHPHVDIPEVFTRWDGGYEAPVCGDTLVDVAFRDGYFSKYGTAAREYRWNHASPNSTSEFSSADIIAYRVSDNHPQATCAPAPAAPATPPDPTDGELLAWAMLHGGARLDFDCWRHSIMAGSVRYYLPPQSNVEPVKLGKNLRNALLSAWRDAQACPF